MKKEEFLSQSSTLLSEAFTSIIEKAYEAGYEQGKADQEALTQPVVKEDNLDWVDLSLPCNKRVARKRHYCGDEYGEAYVGRDDMLTLDEANELLEYCIFDLRISVTRSTGTKWPILELVSAKGVRLHIKQFNYNTDPDGKVVDIWVNAPSNTAVKSTVIRVTINTIEPFKKYDVRAELIEGVFKGQNAVHLFTKEF